MLLPQVDLKAHRKPQQTYFRILLSLDITKKSVFLQAQQKTQGMAQVLELLHNCLLMLLLNVGVPVLLQQIKLNLIHKVSCLQVKTLVRPPQLL